MPRQTDSLRLIKFKELSGEMPEEASRGKLNDRVSEIMEFITEGNIPD